MIGVQTKFEKRQQRLLAAVKRAKAGSLSSAAFLVRESAIDRIKVSKAIRGYFWKTNRKTGKRQRVTYYEPAPPGQSPLAHAKGVGFFRQGLKYDVDKQRDSAIVGFTYSQLRDVMSVHEHGLTRKKTKYAKRPTMVPALQKNVEQFHKSWRASIG